MDWFLLFTVTVVAVADDENERTAFVEISTKLTSYFWRYYVGVTSKKDWLYLRSENRRCELREEISTCGQTSVVPSHFPVFVVRLCEKNNGF